MSEKTITTPHYFRWTSEEIDDNNYRVSTTRCRGLAIQRDGYRWLFNNGDIDTGTKFLLENLQFIVPNSQLSFSVLDLGCGSGIIAMWISAYWQQKKFTSSLHIDACDISPLAVACTQHNMTKYHLKNTKVILSDILANDYFQDKAYDLILTNPPFAAGKKVVRGFLRQGYEHLAPDGQIRCVAPTNKWAKSHIAYCQTLGSVTVVAVEKWWRVRYVQKN